MNFDDTKRIPLQKFPTMEYSPLIQNHSSKKKAKKNNEEKKEFWNILPTFQKIGKNQGVEYPLVLFFTVLFISSFSVFCFCKGGGRG